MTRVSSQVVESQEQSQGSTDAEFSQISGPQEFDQDQARRLEEVAQEEPGVASFEQKETDFLDEITDWLQRYRQDREARMSVKLGDDIELQRLKDTATPFQRKFERNEDGEIEPFGLGETVWANFHVDFARDQDGALLPGKVTLRVDVDGRYTDYFKTEVSPELYEYLRDSMGTTFEGAVTIRSEGVYLVSACFEYEATIDGLVAHVITNPSPSEIAEMEPGMRTLVEGVLIGIEPMGDYRQMLRVRTASGEIHSVLADNNIEYEDSLDLELPRDTPPEVGDTIRLSTITRRVKDSVFGDDYQLISDNPSSIVLDASYSRSAFLLDASEGRAAEFRALRESISARISEFEQAVEKGEYDSARDIFAAIQKFQLLSIEKKEVQTLRGSMPAHERPMLIRDRYRIEDISKFTPEDIDSLTETEFVEVQMRTANDPNGELAGATTLLRLLEESAVSQEVKEKILTNAVQTRLKYLQEISVLGDGFGFSGDFGSQFYFEKAVGMLGELQSETATERIVNTLQQLTDLYDEFGSENGRIREVIRATSTGLLSAVRGYDSGALAVARKSMPQLEAVRQRLIEDGAGSFASLDAAMRIAAAGTVWGSSAEFIEDIRRAVEKLAPDNIALRQMGRVLLAGEYQILPYDQSIRGIPQHVHEFFRNPQIMAATYPTDNLIYFSQNAVERWALTKGENPHRILAETIGNEAVHLVLDSDRKWSSFEEVLEDLQTITPYAQLSPSEERFGLTLAEEIISEYVGRATGRRIEEPNFKFLEDDISFESKTFTNTANLLAAAVAERTLYLSRLVDDVPYDILVARIDTLMRSARFVQRIQGSLRQFEVLEDE